MALRIRRVRKLYEMEGWMRSLPEPSTDQRPEEFYTSSCAKWAASEAIKAVAGSKSQPQYVMERLIKKMDDYSCRDSVHDKMFGIAYDTLTWMYDDLFL